MTLTAKQATPEEPRAQAGTAGAGHHAGASSARPAGAFVSSSKVTISHARGPRAARARSRLFSACPDLKALYAASSGWPASTHVADRVEDLVLDELVVVAQAFAVQHLVLVDDDRVVHAAAERQAARPHHLDVLGEAEGARAGDLALVLARAHVEDEALAGLADRRVVELDLEAERVALVRLEARPFRARALAFADLDRASGRAGSASAPSCSAMPALCSRKTNDAAEPSRIGTSSAVMSTTQVVEAEAGAGRQQVLDRLHLRRRRGRRRPTASSPCGCRRS